MAAVDSTTAQMNTFKSYVTMLADPGCKDDLKLMATQEISRNFEMIVSSPTYPGFLDHTMKIFVKILQEWEIYFIVEENMQQARKLILEMIHRFPTNELLRPYVKPILTLMFKLLEIENEENILVALKIIIELHKQYRPPFNREIQQFLEFVKSIYRDLPNHMDKIFEPKPPLKIKDLTDLNMEEVLKETFTITTVQTEKKTKKGIAIVYNLIPKAIFSLKVLQELPIIVVLMYQLYKQNVHQDVSDFIPLIMSTITLQPTLEQRQAEYFNQEIFVDFMGAQIKTLSFLAYIIKIYQEVVANHSTLMVQGMLQLLALCPMDVAHLRRELLIAARHILATDLRNKFVPHIEKLFDEDVLLGRGWTTQESLRPLAYSTLADLVHHVRQHLPFADLARAVHFFSKNVHDDTLATTIQTMSCKLLLNLVECIRITAEAERQDGRDLLMRMLEVFVLKFKTIAKIQLPILIQKSKQQQQQQQPETKSEGETKLSAVELLDNTLNDTPKEGRTKIGFPVSPAHAYNVADFRSLVKTLVCGVKTITWGCATCKAGTPPTLVAAQPFQPHETLVFVRLVKWALKALDIYTLEVVATAQPAQAGSGPPRFAQQNLRTKDEKEVLEHFSGVFSMMSPQTFHEIFSTTIEYLVERVNKNMTLQIIPNTLLTKTSTSPIFATVLVEYLLDRMEEMGCNVERSNLYLRLFKLVFASVSLFAQENENMLRPHLHKIVNRSMELAMSAKEPYNYFLLLRALFRSIGGGSHDLLYQEFLPLLPNLLEGLNRLQSGLHKQHMKDLFVELCLTVPVRLSSLLPYLPMLMDPLVSALNGSHVLISQGLRTLELCVDNLQHDFLYEHIQPVRADLMQALWRTLRNNDQVAQVAFKVLGKFGGGNRKMMTEPQKLEYVAMGYKAPAIVAMFNEQQHAIEFPVERTIETAFNALKVSATEPFYRKQAWEVINSYLVASLSLNDDRNTLMNLFLHPSFLDGGTVAQVKGASYKSTYKQSRDTHQTALTGMFVAAAIKELRSPVVSTMVAVVRHYTMVAVAQEAGAFAITPKPNEQTALDPLVLIDAFAVIMGHEEKELCKPGELALAIMLDTATTLLGTIDIACKLPLVEYLSERMCSLCYERAWYAKLGGCIAIRFMFKRCAPRWIYEHIFTFLKALLFVMMDLTDEVSSGALDMAKANLEEMLIVCVTPPATGSDADVFKKQADALSKVTHELVRQITSPHTLVREQSMASLRLLARKQNKTVTAVMEPFKDVLVDIVPPKKHLLKHQPAIFQMGLMDGNEFCTTLKPRLFTIDIAIPQHKTFIDDLESLCRTDDAKLNSFSCYKSISNFNPLRISALRVLAACHYLDGKKREEIFDVLYRTLEKPNPELQHVAFECMKNFIAGYQVEEVLIHQTIRPLLLTLGDVKILTLNRIKMLSYLTQLFPYVFKEKLCEELIKILKQLLEKLVETHKASNSISKKGEEEQKVMTIISIFNQTPAATAKFIDQLCQLIIHTEQALMVEASSPFRDVLMHFLLRFPADTLDLFLLDGHVKQKPFSRYLAYLLKHADGKPFRDHMQSHKVHRLRALVLAHAQPQNTASGVHLTETDRYELQHQGIRLVALLIKFDDQWLAAQPDLVDALKLIWCNDAYLDRHKRVNVVECAHWMEPKWLAKVLLHHFCHHPNDIDLLFQLLRATCDRFIPEFQFLRDFLENTVAHSYTVEWKRSAFFRFVELFATDAMSQDLKAKVVQLILIPAFAMSFERGETNKLIGSAPAPYNDSTDNVVSVFINKLIDPDVPFPFAVSDCVRIALLQFSCLLIDQASSHIHDYDPSKEGQGFKLRKLMTFAWPCLLGKNCVDPATRYHGHLLLSHVIDKFAIHRKIVLQVFHSLLKAHAVEARGVVRQALEILTPSIPVRVGEGYTMLVHWTKKIIVDEGHSIQQLFHILQLVVKQHKVYYPVRHHLVQHMINSIQRLGFSPTATLEHRKLAVELAEVIIRWELYGIKEEAEADTAATTTTTTTAATAAATLENVAQKRAAEEAEVQRKRVALQQQQQQQPSTSAAVSASNSPAMPPLAVPKTEPGVFRSLDRLHIDTVLNFLLRLACQVNELPPANQVNAAVASPGELLSRRCVILLKTALKPDLWQQPPDLKLIFLDKILLSVESGNPNIGNICTGLELLTFLLNILTKEQILTNFRTLHRSLGVCITSSNARIIRLLHGLLSKLMSIFPTERTNASMTCKHEELEVLYATVSKMILEGLTNYEKNKKATPSTLFGTIMILKAACASNHSYIDLLITPFMNVLHKLAEDHLDPNNPESSPMTSELLILSLDLVKTRVVVMGVEMRKTFIGSILVGLIEKTPDIKIMKAITKMLEEWMKNKNVITLSQAPSLREKSILLVKMMQYVEKRFPDEVELNAQFLELVNYVYTDEQLKQSELTAKLEPAFLAGLRCAQPHIRAKFFKVFDASMRRRLFDRLLYITCSQNWDAIGPHYWLKQCIELLLVTVTPDTRIQMSHESCILPSITSVIGQGNPEVKKEFYDTCKEATSFEPAEIKEEILDVDPTRMEIAISQTPSVNRAEAIRTLIAKHCEFIEVSENITTERFLNATAQLCHMDTELAEQIWLKMFPRLWDILDEQQRNTLVQEIVPFITSGTHIIQKDCHPSAIDTIVEALSRCNPPIQIASSLMKHLGKSHNLWHRMALDLEHMAFDSNTHGKHQPSPIAYDAEPKHEILDALGELYALLKEEDLWAGLWQKHAHYKETNVAIALEQHGFYEQAQAAYEVARAKHKQEGAVAPLPYHTQCEVHLWSNHWIRCAKELNQWDVLYEYAKNGVYDPYLLLESAWRIPNWETMKEAMSNVEYNCPKELAWKVTLYGGYLLICHPEDKPLKFAERYVETASMMCLNEWRRLPHIVSHIHLPYLQAAQQIMELQEAHQIHKGLIQGHQNSLHDMKAIVKTWRNRLPVIADDLSHWNDIFTWRQHHYQFITKHFENLGESSNNNLMLGAHAAAQSIIYFGKIARKHKLSNVCLDSLNKIYTITSMPIVNCFQKIRQQVKCYLQLASMNNDSELQKGIEMISSTNVKYFTKEMMAEFYALTGLLCQLSGKSEEANKSFSVAVQMHDNSTTSWALYGDYLEQIFTRDPRQIALGVNAVTCFLHACRQQNESKARKYLAKVLWLLNYDDEKSSLIEVLDKYSVGVPPILWVPWIPQLLTRLVQHEKILNLILQVGRMFPQAVYFPIRTLYFTLRTATTRSTINAQMHAQESRDNDTAQSHNSNASTSSASSMESSTIKATPAMYRCSGIMKMQLELHTTVVSSLESIANQMEWFRENWCEEVVRQLRQGLAKCYAIAFENRENVSEAKITPHIFSFFKKLVATFGIGFESIEKLKYITFNSAASESLARRAEETYKDPVFKETKAQFTKEFDVANLSTMKLHTLIQKLKQWIKQLENRCKMLTQSFLMEEKCRFLSNFTLKTAEVELPGEFLLPKHTHYYVRITRFMPRVDVVQKHNYAARRLYIRGHNGKIYPYLVFHDSGLADARREERVLQVNRMLNHYLGKQKETAKRFLHFTVPRVVAVSQQIRLVEDNPSSLSLLDIYKRGCSKAGKDHEEPIRYYYERLVNVQSRGIKVSHQVYRDILKGVQATMVPKGTLRAWAVATFPSATDYWHFRKMFTLQLALACFAEYVLHLTRLNPDMIYLHQDSGQINISYFRFDVDECTGELNTTRAVPFRLTPNIVEFLSAVNINGPLTASMIAIARCLVYPNFKVQSVLKTILRDELALSRIKKLDDAKMDAAEKLTEAQHLVNSVVKAVNSINHRLNTLAQFDGVESKVSTLVVAANSTDNLCRMDPAWHPWL